MKKSRYSLACLSERERRAALKAAQDAVYEAEKELADIHKELMAQVPTLFRKERRARAKVGKANAHFYDVYDQVVD